MSNNLAETLHPTRAFTLIELLVVIGIIGVLATVGTINFGNARAASRDAKRQTDMQGLSLGLRLYLARTANLPDQTVASNWNSFLILIGASGIIPPIAQEDYCYYRSVTQDSYALVATDFERELPGNVVTDMSGTSLIVESGGDGNCYGRVGIGPQCGEAGSVQSGGGNDYCLNFRVLKLFDM